MKNSIKISLLFVALFTVMGQSYAQNVKYEIAPQEYANLTEKSIHLLITLDVDRWATMLSDDVEYTFPDGDLATRTKLAGKKAVVAWWKNYKKTSGIQSMSADEMNLIPVTALQTLKGGAKSGTYVFCYFSNKLVFKNGSTALRMNFSIHFNAKKQIDRIFTYYDRTLLIKAMGKNMLDKK